MREEMGEEREKRKIGHQNKGHDKKGTNFNMVASNGTHTSLKPKPESGYETVDTPDQLNATHTSSNTAKLKGRELVVNLLKYPSKFCILC